MKNWLKRGKTGNNSSRDDISLPLSSQKIHSEGDSSYIGLSANETQSIISEQEPPSHQPPSQFAGHTIPGSESTSTKSRIYRGSVATNMNHMASDSKTRDEESEVKIPEKQLELIKTFFKDIPDCESLAQRKILISSEHYFRVALESYEHLRAVHYRASQNFTLAEWLHIHALLLYGRIQQVQLGLNSKGSITQHNKIDLSGDIKVFSPIASILAAIGGVEDRDNGVLYIPDAVYPERPSSEAAYSAAEMQQILNGTLYDWQRSWGRVLEARFERDSRDVKFKMTRSASDLMTAIRDIADSIDKIRQRQQTIEEGSECNEEYIIKLASKERNLSLLFEEARNAKDYTLRPPCDRVYNFQNPAFSASDPTLDVKPKRTSTLMEKDSHGSNMYQYQKNASVPDIFSPAQVDPSSATAIPAAAVSAPVPSSTPRSPPAAIPTCPTSSNRHSGVYVGSPNVLHNALIFPTNNHQHNRHQPNSKAVIMDEDIIPVKQNRRNRRGFHAGSPEMRQNQAFGELKPNYSLDPKMNATVRPRRFSSLRNQFTQISPLVPNADTPAYRPAKMNVATGPVETKSSGHASAEAAKVAEEKKLKANQNANSVHKEVPGMQEQSELQFKRESSVAPLSPPISSRAGKKVTSESSESPSETTNYFNNYVQESFNNSEASLLTPPDTSFESDVGSLGDTQDPSLSVGDDSNDNDPALSDCAVHGSVHDLQFSGSGSNSGSGSGSGSEMETGFMSDFENEDEDVKSFTTADDSRFNKAGESTLETTLMDQDHTGVKTSSPGVQPSQEFVENINSPMLSGSSPLLPNRRFTPDIPDRTVDHTASLARALSTSRKSARKVTIGGSSDNLDQFVHYDAQLWSDYVTFVNSISDAKLATFEPIPTTLKGDLSWALAVNVNHKSPQREITIKLPHKKVSKQEQVLALILQTCYERQAPVQHWHNEVHVDVDLRELVSKYVATAVDDRTL